MIDNHPADLGTELFERSKDLSLHELRLMTLQEINMALERIANGSYGLCLACGREIGDERLKALPYAGYCIVCQASREAEDDGEKGSRPVEELVSSPPFKRTFLKGSDYTGYDGEDAWQEVARYGTSSTPQDIPVESGNSSFVSSGENAGIVDKMDKLPSTRRKWKEKEDTKGEGSAGRGEKG